MKYWIKKQNYTVELERLKKENPTPEIEASISILSGKVAMMQRCLAKHGSPPRAQ